MFSIQNLKNHQKVIRKSFPSHFKTQSYPKVIKKKAWKKVMKSWVLFPKSSQDPKFSQVIKKIPGKKLLKSCESVFKSPKAFSSHFLVISESTVWPEPIWIKVKKSRLLPPQHQFHTQEAQNLHQLKSPLSDPNLLSKK